MHAGLLKWPESRLINIKEQKMTSRELINKMFKHEKVERVGLMDNPWASTLKKWVEQGYPKKEGTDDPADAGEYFGFDMRGVGGWFDILPLRGFSEVVEESDEWITRRNGAGAALKYWKAKEGTPEHVHFLMTSREIWEKDYRHHLLELDKERVDVKGAAEALKWAKEKGYWTFYGNMFIWENMRQSMGDFCMYQSLALDPEWIHDYNRVYTDFFKMHY